MKGIRVRHGVCQLLDQHRNGGNPGRAKGPGGSNSRLNDANTRARQASGALPVAPYFNSLTAVEPERKATGRLIANRRGHWQPAHRKPERSKETKLT